MRLSVTHTTEYKYDAPVTYALQKVRLRPLASPLQEVVDWSIGITGGRIETGYHDHYGNHVDLVSADAGATSLILKASGTIETTDKAGILGHVFGRAPLWHFAQGTEQTAAGPTIAALTESIDRTDDTVADLHALSNAIRAAAPYRSGVTDSGTSAEDALIGGNGVCQDHAQIFVSAARLWGLPARYVSGYLMLNDSVDQDASHAWAEVYLHTLGWVGFDVSNGVSPDGRYVRLAIGNDARSAAPVSGMRVGAGDETLIVSVQVQQ